MELKDIMAQLHSGVGEVWLEKLKAHMDPTDEYELNTAEIRAIQQFLKDNHIDTVPTAGKVHAIDRHVQSLNLVDSRDYPDAEDPIFKKA